MWWLLLLIPAMLLLGYFRDRRRSGAVKARRSLLFGIVGISLCYVVALFSLLMLENQLLFQPISFEEVNVDTSSFQHESVSLASSDGNTLVAWWCPQEGADWTILYCHGTGGNLSIHTTIVPMLQKAAKVNVLAVAYPGYSGSTGSPSEAGCYAAGEAAHDWLVQQKKAAPARILLLGQSLGGGVACELAQRRPHAALVLLSTFATLPSRAQELIPLFPVNWLMKNRFDNLAKIKQYHGPLFIAHGDNDDVVPLHHGEELFAAAASPQKEFYRISGGTHVTVNQEFLRRVAALMARLP